MELRVELYKAQLQEWVEARKTDAIFGVLIAVFAALAGLFFLITLGFVFSAILRALLGWSQLAALSGGFGVVVLLLALGAAVSYLKSPFNDSSS